MKNEEMIKPSNCSTSCDWPNCTISSCVAKLKGELTYYYSQQTNELRQIDRMPPDQSDYTMDFEGIDELERDTTEFVAYLSKQPLIPHTFSGESRVIPEGEIEWKYAWLNYDLKWVEVSEDLYETITEQRRRVATPKITEGGKGSMCGIHKEHNNDCPMCNHEPLTAQPDKQGEEYVSAIKGVICFEVINYLKNVNEHITITDVLPISERIFDHLKLMDYLSPSPAPETGEKELMMVDLPKPTGDFIIAQKDIPFTQASDGAYWHYKDVITLLHRYAGKQPHSPVQALTTDEEAAEAYLTAEGKTINSIDDIEKNAFLAGCAHERAQQGEGSLRAIKEIESAMAWLISELSEINKTRQDEGISTQLQLAKNAYNQIPQLFCSSQQPVDAVAFAEWVFTEGWLLRKGTNTWANPKSNQLPTTEKLLTLFSYQTKQP